MRPLIYILVFISLLIQCKPADNQVAAAITTEEKSNLATQIQTDTMPTPDLDYIMGKFEPERHDSFIEIPMKYADRSGMYMRKEALEAFVKMYDAALLSGVNMQIKSATRNFDYQKGIWERKYTGETILSDGTNVAKDISQVEDKCLKILEFSSMPGTSRHHWGTDIDINSFNNEYFDQGEGKKVYEWMLEYASSFGYCQPYTPHSLDRPHGYHEEKWHWSYMPISRELSRQAEIALTDDMIQGFLGSEASKNIQVVDKYVLGINPLCR